MDITIEKQSPVTSVNKEDGFWFADFGKAAFGRLEYVIETDNTIDVELVIGEVLSGEHQINREPGGYRCAKTAIVSLQPGVNRGFMPIKKHRSPYQDTYQRSKVLTPECAGGEIAPFRYAEVHGSAKSVQFVRHALFAPFDDSSSSFVSSDDNLNRVWDFCKYTMKATSAFGLYIDGERERQCFEGDAYINALGAYCTGGGYEVARRTLDFLISFYPISALEYRLLTPVMVHDYFLYSGDTDIYRYWKNELPSRLMPQFQSDDGLFHIPVEAEGMSQPLRDLHLNHQYLDMFPDMCQLLIDWPMNERDGYDFGELNFAPHAFLYAALCAMHALEPNQGYGRRAEQLLKDIYRLFRRNDGRYCDSSASEHTALHTAAWAIAWDVAQPQDLPALVDFIQSKGMACSVYGAQFLLDACFKAGAEQTAIDMMRSDGPRSWIHMMEQGSTISMEAWSNECKPNQDWNHAWGAAPANVIPRRLAGIRPIANGFRKFIVDPKPGNLKSFAITHPTPLGGIVLEYSNNRFQLTVPEGAEAVHANTSFASGRHDFRLN